MPIGARPVDIAHLSRYTGGDADLNAEVLMLFTNQSVDILNRLDEALKNGDGKMWRQLAHSIKGGARGIGAFSLAETAEAAEPVDVVEETAQARRALDDLKLRNEAVRRFVDAYLKR